MSIFRSETVAVDRDSDGSFVVTIDVPGRAVNVLTGRVIADLDAALDELAKLPRLPVVAVRSGKPTGFLAGADLAEFTAIRDTAEALAVSERGQRLFDKLAALPGPSVAVVAGPCLGGGLELALACDYRLVFDRPSTQLGLPEVELGLLPGWGGTQRLPRVVGLERALKVILGGRRLDAKKALQWGLSDAIAATEAELRERYAKLLVRAVGEGKRRRDRLPLSGWRQKLLESNPIGRRLILRGTERLIRTRVPDDMPAPAEALGAVRLGLERGVAEGLKREREAASRLAVSPACRNLIGLFFQRESLRKPAGIESAREVKRVGVVGAGVMGAGIAQLAALQGRDVVVQEVNQAALAAGMARLDDLFAKAAERKRVSAEEAKARRAAVKGTTSWEGFASVDLVIEAAVEDLELKRNLFKELAARVGPDCVLATNTSSLAVARVQEGLPHPQRVGGMHFFNPVHKMPLVEVVRPPATSEATAALLTKFAIDLGKVPVRVGDGPGFVVNRVLMPYLDEAVRLVGEGLPIAEIDALMRRFGMPMGPLALLDQIGLDVAAHVARLVRMQLGRPAEEGGAFERMREKGWLGEKAKLGFYRHGAKSTPHREAQELMKQSYSGSSPSLKLPKAARLAEARERLVLPMVNEAAAALADGLADAATIDVAMVFGTGWAPHRGGPLSYAGSRGVGDVARSLEQLASRHGPRFAPCAELSRRAATDAPFRPTGR